MTDTLMLHGFNNIKYKSSDWISLRSGPRGFHVCKSLKWWDKSGRQYVNAAVFDATTPGGQVIIKVHVTHSSRLLITYDSTANKFTFDHNLSVDHVGIFDTSDNLIEHHILPKLPKTSTQVKKFSQLPARATVPPVVPTTPARTTPPAGATTPPVPTTAPPTAPNVPPVAPAQPHNAPVVPTPKTFTVTGHQHAPLTAVTKTGPDRLRKQGGPYTGNKWMANPIPDNQFNGSGVAPFTSTFQWQAADPSSDLSQDSSWTDLPGATRDSFLGSTYRPKSAVQGKWIRVIQIVTDSDTPTPGVDRIPGPPIGPLHDNIPLLGAMFNIQVKGGGTLSVGSIVELVEIRPISNGFPPYVKNIHWKVLDNAFDSVVRGNGTEQAEKGNELTITQAMVGKYISANIEYQDSSNPPWRGNVAANHVGTTNPTTPLGPVV